MIVKLTNNHNGQPVYVNTNQVEGLHSETDQYDDTYTVISISENIHYEVIESIDFVYELLNGSPTEYTTVIADPSITVDEKVMELMQEGWCCYGSPYSDTEGYTYQAMTR